MKWSFPCGDQGLLKTITIIFKKIRINILHKKITATADFNIKIKLFRMRDSSNADFFFPPGKSSCFG